jgi:TRAP-type transport system periplasmic protein
MKRTLRVGAMLCAVAMIILAASGDGLAQKKYVIKIAHNQPADPKEAGPHAGALAFKESVEKETNGQVEVQVYHSGQLGDQRVMLESVQMGTLEASSVGDAVLVNFFPPVGVIGIPYLFKDSATAWKVLDGKFGQELSKALVEKTGIRILAYGENGFRHFTNSKREIKRPADMKGLKMRVQENPAHVKMVSAMGGIPVPMAWTEVYTSLQQGVLDGQENPLSVIVVSKLWEVQKYLILDSHLWAASLLVINDKLFQSYPNDIKTAILNAVPKYNESVRGVTQRIAREGVSILQSKGMKVHSPTNAELGEFQSVAQKPAVDSIKTQVPQEWIDRAIAAAAEAGK